MTETRRDGIERRLLRILDELEKQGDASPTYPPDALPFAEEMDQIREWIEAAGEYGLAYETLVAAIETHPFVLSGAAALSLLEVGLLLGYKTDRKEDASFDRRDPEAAHGLSPPRGDGVLTTP